MLLCQSEEGFPVFRRLLVKAKPDIALRRGNPNHFHFCGTGKKKKGRKGP
jgi:hypothetical protein